jgi:aryl-alcohol dehydrogenase-like predicted oxidoreductase
MVYRKLGSTGEKISAIGLGGFHIGVPKDANEGIKIIRTALDRGMNFLDNCWDYHDGDSEVRMGKALRDGYRQKAFLMTKFDGRTKQSTIKQIDESLKRLQTDHIDLIQYHENIRMEDPDRFFAPNGPLEAVMEAKQAGKIRYIGASNFSGWHLMKSLAISEKYGWARHVAHQAYYSLIGRSYEWELMPLALDQGVGAVVWSPLGWGRLTGKIKRGQPLPAGSRLHQTADYGPPVEDAHLFNVTDALDAITAETGKTVPQIAINWLLQRPTVSSVIIGARNEAQLKDNLGAVGWSLTADQMKRLDVASATTPAYPHFPYYRQEGFARLNPPAV